MKRIVWIDDLKGLLIVLIVAGHVFATLSTMTFGEAKGSADFVFAFIYSFHIPFFFLIAGMTLPPPSACSCNVSEFMSFARHRFQRIMVPYYFWGCLCAFVFVALGQRVSSEMQSLASSGCFAERTIEGTWYVPFLSLLHAGCWPNGQGFRFNGVLWFLPMLFICHIVHFWLVRFVRSVAGILFIATLSMVFTANLTKGVFDMNLPFDLTRVPIHLTFLALGHWFGCMLFHDGRNERGKKTCFYYAGAILLLGYVVAARFYPISMTRGYAAYSLNNVLKALPTIFVIAIMAKMGIFRKMSIVAPVSIGIMIFHKYPLVCAQIGIGKMHFGWLNSPVPSMMLGIGLTVFLVGLCYFVSKLVIRIAPWSLGLYSKPQS